MDPTAARTRQPALPRWLLAALLPVLWLGLGAAVPAVRAADLQVNPIMVEFADGEQSQALWLSNSGTKPLKAQVRVADWTQDGGEDVQTPTRSLLASPAILEIAPGQQQLVRLIRTEPVPLQSEAAYRLTIDELPGEKAPEQSGLQFLLRYSIPVFVTPQGLSPLGPTRKTATTPDPAGLSFRLEPAGEASVLRVANPGRQRVRFSAMYWEGADGKRTELSPGLLGYVLAGKSRQWTIPLPPALYARGGTLRARINDDTSDRALPLDGAGS